MGQILVRINFHCLKISFEFLGQRNKRKLAPNENFLLYGSSDKRREFSKINTLLYINRIT